MIKVLYDHQMFSLQQYGGISRYFANLYTSFKSSTAVQPSIAALHSKNHYIEHIPLAAPHWVGRLLLSKKKRMYKWNRWYSKKIIRQQNFDLFHPTYYDPYFLDAVKKPFVVTVYDMIYELFPEYFEAGDKFVLNKKKIIEAADHLIAISHSTKNDLMRLYNIPDSKITVVHLGYLQEIVILKAKVDLPENYILFVGERTNYKNFLRFFAAVLPVFKKYPSYQLICTGGGSFKKEEMDLFQQNRLLHRVIQISASDQLMSQLYSNALLFVFPSLYEGFGLPLLEAFSNNCPVACSNTSSFVEVGGNAVDFFNPESKEDITRSIFHIIEDETYAYALRAEGKKQLQKFSVLECAKQTETVYKNVLL